jgi:hypothetical protein
MISTKIIVSNSFDVPSSWIFEQYCSLSEKLAGQDVKIKSMFNTRDSVPSMVIFCRGDGDYYFKDFSTDKGGTGVRLVMELFNLSLGDAVNKIVVDYTNYLKRTGGFSTPKTIVPKVNYKLETYDTRKWNKNDADYWTKYGIDSEILKEYRVDPLSAFTFSKVDGGVYSFFTSEKPYVYGFFREDGTLYKIYQPFNKDKKFMKLKDYVQGIDQLKFNKSLLVVTSSLKDGMSLLKLGYPIEFIAPDSEGSVLREELVRSLKTKYKKIICIFDNDIAGITAMKRYEDLFEIPYVILPLEKDISDSIKKHGQQKTKEVLTPLINQALKK